MLNIDSENIPFFVVPNQEILQNVKNSFDNILLLLMPIEFHQLHYEIPQLSSFWCIYSNRFQHMTNIILGTVCLEIMWSEVQVNKATEIITLTANIGRNKMEINHLFNFGPCGKSVNSSTTSKTYFNQMQQYCCKGTF